MNAVSPVARRTMLYALALAAVSTAAPTRAGEAQLGAWRDYALRGITPEYQWADRPAVEAVRPSVIDSLQPVRTMRMPELQFDAAPATEGGISLGVSRAFAVDTPFTDGRVHLNRSVTNR